MTPIPGVVMSVKVLYSTSGTPHPTALSVGPGPRIGFHNWACGTEKSPHSRLRALAAQLEVPNKCSPNGSVFSGFPYVVGPWQHWQ
jgi:hypothetical protein